MKIVLPWPDKRLNPNKHEHWHKLHLLKKRAKTFAYAKTRCFYNSDDWIEFPKKGKIKVTITFNPPDSRRRDKDNLIASMKGAQDGVALALGVDDYRFDQTYIIGDVIKGGQVVFEVHK